MHTHVACSVALSIEACTSKQSMTKLSNRSISDVPLCHDAPSVEDFAKPQCTHAD